MHNGDLAGPDLGIDGRTSTSGFKSRPPRQRTFMTGKLVYGDGDPSRRNALSLDCAGQVFYDFQWDALLLETTFLAIFAFLIYTSTTHHPVDFALTYRRVGFPAGVVVMAVSLAYLATQWARRKLRA